MPLARNIETKADFFLQSEDTHFMPRRMQFIRNGCYEKEVVQFLVDKCHTKAGMSFNPTNLIFKVVLNRYYDNDMLD